MLTKQEHIQHWYESANDDWETSEILLQSKRYAFCLFSMHLVIEKILKAIWVKESISDNTPPFTHDLVRLAEECGLELSPEELDFLTVINGWNIRGRYPDFTRTLHRNTTDDYLKIQRAKVKKLKEWLEKKI